MQPTNDHLMTCVAEEAVEIAEELSTLTRNISKIACKCLRFGNRHTSPTRDVNNINRLVEELNDLIAVADMLAARGVIPKTWRNKEHQKAKKEKVMRLYMEALRRGADG